MRLEIFCCPFRSSENDNQSGQWSYLQPPQCHWFYNPYGIVFLVFLDFSNGFHVTDQAWLWSCPYSDTAHQSVCASLGCHLLVTSILCTSCLCAPDITSPQSMRSRVPDADVCHSLHQLFIHFFWYASPVHECHSKVPTAIIFFQLPAIYQHMFGPQRGTNVRHREN